MSTLPIDLSSTQLSAMTMPDLGQVLEIEKASYSHPWTLGNFQDTLRAGHWAQTLRAADSTLLGYVVAMPGVQEAHLLNLTVAGAFQGQGLARHMLDALMLWSRQQGALSLWLEVRVSNERARHLYVACGFQVVTERKNYYPGLGQDREHAIVMQRPVTPLA
jgi:ribosomal-protein-alanine N-acetyltransferase